MGMLVCTTMIEKQRGRIKVEIGLAAGGKLA